MGFPGGWLGNQRTIAIPIVPGAIDPFTVTAAATTDRRTYTLSATNLANARVDLYVHWFTMYGQKTAAASAIDIAFQWQFFNGGGAAVGAAIPLMPAASVGWNGAAAAGVANNCEFFPSWPHHIAAAIPATSVTVRLQSVAANIAGAPSIGVTVASGADPTNGGPPGDIGGLAVQAQGANNPNAF
jgi:hypothetical protein